MTVFVGADETETARAAADVVEGVLRESPSAVLGLATGASVDGVYRELIAECGGDGTGLSFAGASAFLLDEYVGLDASHPQAYRNVIRAELIDRVDLADGAVRGPDAWAPDLDAAAAEYDEAVRVAGVDVQLLGIGRNGHIAFNEPGAAFDSRTRVVDLSETTRRDNARFFGSPDDVPRRAITQGIGTILAARRVVLVAHGKEKADAIAAAIDGPTTCDVPASALQLHTRVTWVLDPAAASRLA
ncbi:MAG TPA: glucosamine-6-phosphate deaminase [Acidimicrobiaceae bacterium]|nr:glucosamine-6-phosphate deaminase [Acidimicrobiaceae bacterium]HCB37580.1 glucosamine-6-phosphate deaminase [Acidimicrobiaceae bacterium]